MVNPTITWTTFQNWFMGKSEGQDGEYNAAFWEDPNLTFQQQELPAYQAYYNGMPRTADGSLMQGADNIYGLVKGKVLKARTNDTRGYTDNTCALKVSIALNNAGVSIPNILGETLEGGGEFEGKFFFLNARALNSWMRLTFGINPNNTKHISCLGTEGGKNGEVFPKKFKDKIGIYSMVTTNEYRIATGMSGHADLLFPKSDGLATCTFGCFFERPIERIDFWILDYFFFNYE